MELPRHFGNNVPEQFVFDLLERSSRWGRLSANYQDHAIDFITNVLGGVGRQYRHLTQLVLQTNRSINKPASSVGRIQFDLSSEVSQSTGC